MAIKVDFSKDIYTQLQAESSEAQIPLLFPEWDILKELDRRAKRKQRDKGTLIREYMRDHPEEVERLREKIK